MAMETEQTTDGLVIGRNAVAELLAVAARLSMCWWQTASAPAPLCHW